MADFLKAYALVKGFEGGWCDVEGDAGGETYAGIARNFFPAWPGWAVVDEAKKHCSFYQGAAIFSCHLAQLPSLADMVADWYRTEWWERMGLAFLPQPVANELFEQAVNLGRAGSGKYVQRLCNACNCRRIKGGYERLFADLVIDGVLGPKSLDALAAILKERLEVDELLHGLNALQACHYISLAASSFSHRKFLDGWMKRTHAPEKSE